MRSADKRFMTEALALAAQAAERDDVPVGALLVMGRDVIGRGHNRRVIDGDPTAHAEIVALREAARSCGNWRLDGATLYATLEPCAMCAGALVHARVGRLVYACDDPKGGAVRSLYALLEDPRAHHRVEVTRGVLADESAALLKAFFAARRRSSKIGGSTENP